MFLSQCLKSLNKTRCSLTPDQTAVVEAPPHTASVWHPSPAAGVWGLHLWHWPLQALGPEHLTPPQHPLKPNLHPPAKHQRASVTDGGAASVPPSHCTVSASLLRRYSYRWSNTCIKNEDVKGTDTSWKSTQSAHTQNYKQHLDVWVSKQDETTCRGPKSLLLQLLTHL